MILEIVLVILTLILLLYRYVTKNFDHWKKKGVPHIQGVFPCGSHTEILTQGKHISVLVKEDYEKFKEEDFFGIYMLGKPALVVKNIDMIRNIMVKDFNHFVDRNGESMRQWAQGGDMDQLWAKGMSELCGEHWKDVRSSFSPIFTSGKMKGMLKFIAEVGQSLKKDFHKLAESGQDFELKEEFGKFSLDSLACCAFGLNPKSFEDNSGVFAKYAASVFQASVLDNIKIMTRFLPGSVFLQQKLNINFFKPKETKYFKDIILKTIQHRRETGVRVNDLIDLMLDCMKPAGNVEKADIDEPEDVHLKHHKKFVELNEDIIVSNCLLFLVAGYDTTGMTLAVMGYFLSKYPLVQTKLQEEIDQAFEENGGLLPEYQVIQELPYLEMCIMESLRMYSPAGALFRTCTKDYTFPETNVSVMKDDLIILPVIGIHSDESYYPNPEEFNPENFSKEAKALRSPYTFLGFGQGPRGCIGMRFALLEAKVAMIEILHSFSFVYSNKNPEVLELDPSSETGYIKGGLFAKIQKRC